LKEEEEEEEEEMGGFTLGQKQTILGPDSVS
jgi:hypothetical protein